jgi:hypothetical protein
MEYVGMLLMIALISAAIISYGIVLGRREDQGRESSVPGRLSARAVRGRLDPDAHLGRSGAE